MRFAFAHALWLLAFVPLLIALAAREEASRRARLARLVDAGLLPSVADDPSVGRRRALRAAAIVAFVALVVALARPQWGERTELLPRRGLDLVFAIDVSKSMRARDVSPDRLERTKAEIGAALDELGENRVGLVAFAGTAFVQCPLTTDVEAVRLFLRGLDPAVVPQGGTALALGMRTALDLFESESQADGRKPTGRVLVVVSDGEDHLGGFEDIGAALAQASVSTIFVGVGGRLGEPIPIVDQNGVVIGYQKDRTGKTVMTKLAAAALEQAAAAAGGAFVDGTTRADLGMGEVKARLASLEKRDLEARIRTEYVERSTWPAAIAVLLLALATALPERRRR